MKASGSGGGADGTGADGTGAARPQLSADDAAAFLKLETQIRTLRVEPYTLLTAEERKDQANRTKALSHQQARPLQGGCSHSSSATSSRRSQAITSKPRSTPAGCTRAPCAGQCRRIHGLGRSCPVWPASKGGPLASYTDSD